jgi:hypothetical protein
MRKNTRIVFGVVILSTCVSGILWHQLKNEESTSSSLRAQPAKLETRVDTPTSTHAAVEGQVPLSEGSLPKASDPVVATGLEAATPAPVAYQLAVKDEDRPVRLARSRTRVPLTYPGLIEELGLSDDEAAQLIDLIADYQLKASANVVWSAGESEASSKLVEEASKTSEQLNLQMEAAIKAQLGDGKYALWKKYQSERMARVMADGYIRSLESRGLPVSRDQSVKVVNSMIAEQARIVQDAKSARNGQDQSQDEQQAAESMLERQKDNDLRLIASAAPYLSAQQLQVLQTELEERTRAAEDRVRQRFSNQAPRR